MSAIPSKGRAQRVLHWLTEQKAPRTVPEIIAATEPGCSSQNMHGTIACLVNAGKLKRKKTATGRPGLVATKIALVDQRIRSASPPEAKRKRRDADRAEPRQVQVQREVAATLARIAATSTAPATPTPPAPTSRARSTLSSLFTTVAAKRIERDELAADVDAFVAGGGVIQRLRPGESSQTQFGFHQSRTAEATESPDREAQPARRAKRTTA